MSERLGKESLRDMDWQLAEYRRLMGEKATDRQLQLGRKGRGLCICKPTKMRDKWGVITTVHEQGCPRFR